MGGLSLTEVSHYGRSLTMGGLSLTVVSLTNGGLSSAAWILVLMVEESFALAQRSKGTAVDSFFFLIPSSSLPLVKNQTL